MATISTVGYGDMARGPLGILGILGTWGRAFWRFPETEVLRNYPFCPLVNIQKTMERSTIFNG